MNGNLRVDDVAAEVLARQARVRTKGTSEPFGAALLAILETEADRQLGQLRDGPYGDKDVLRWQEDLSRERARERARADEQSPSRIG